MNMADYPYWLLQVLLIPALSPLFIGLTRVIKAMMQNRRGAPVLQPLPGSLEALPQG